MVNLTKWAPKLVLLPFFWLIACGLMLPSDGNHGLMSPKSLSFLMTAYAIFIYFFIKGQFSQYQYRLVALTTMALGALFSYLFITIANDPEAFSMGLDQFKLFLITWVVAIVSLFLIDDKALTGATFLKGVIFFNGAFATLKVFAVALHMLGIIKLWKLMELSGIRFMSLGVTESFSRLQTSVDIVTPYLIFFVLQREAFGLKIGKKFTYFFIAVSILSIILSFSRFLMAVAFASFFFYWISINIPRMARVLLVGVMVVMGAVASIGIDNAEKAFHMRFTSLSNYQSDATRLEQIEALMKEHDAYPLLGLGLGGSAKNYFRDNKLTHSYEVQWVAFLMQFGILGLMLLAMPVIYICFAIMTTPLNVIKLGLFCLFGIWILSGFTNPYMISLTSGIVYAVFIVGGDTLGKKWSTPASIEAESNPLKNT